MTHALRRLVFVPVLAIAAMLLAANAPQPPPPQRHVLIISVDGLRPDCLLRAKSPNIKALMDRGSFTMYAITTDVGITLPSHASMLTGVPPDMHGVDWNKSESAPLDEPYPKVPMIFELAKKQGYTTGMASAKAKFSAFNRPGSVDWYYLPDEETSQVDDAEVVENAERIILEQKPGVMFVHFGNVDKSGHKYGWGAPEQLESIAGADEAVGRVLAALDKAGLRDQTLIILSSDHGGSGRTHGGKTDYCTRYIPFIAVGPGVERNQDLTLDRKLNVHIEDIFATSCAWLSVPMPENVQGVSVTDIWTKIVPEDPDKAKKAKAKS